MVSETRSLIELDLRGGGPIYWQIIDQIRAKVDSEQLAAGDQLPPVRDLAEELDVNFNTVARAYRHLDQAGVISTQQGRGTFVLSPEDREPTGRADLEELVVRFAAQAQAMGFEPEEVAEVVGYILERWDQRGEPG